MEVLGQLGHLGLGPAHLEIGIVLLDFRLQIGQLAAGVFDLHEVIVVGLLVHFELALVLFQLLLGFLELEREFAGCVSVAALQVGFDSGFQAGDTFLIIGELPADPLNQGAVLLQAEAPLLELIDGPVILELHLRNRIRRPEKIGDLVELCLQ